MSSIVRARLTAVLGRRRLPTGTTAARAIHDLFLAEARQQGQDAAEQAWSALDDQKVREIGRELERIVWGGRSTDYALPAGTEVMAGITGCAFVGSETLGFNVDRPGLRDVQELPTRTGGSNLALLMRCIDELSRDLPCRILGLPVLVDRYNGKHTEQHLRFHPCAAAGGAVLRRLMDYDSWGEYFCALPRNRVRELAASIVADMSRLSTDGHRLASDVEATRREAVRVASGLREVRVYAVAIDVGHLPFRSESMSVEFETWDHAFRRGITVQPIRTVPGSANGFNAAALDRADAVAQVRALGATGWIGGLARAILEVAPGGPAETLRQLAQSNEAFLALQAAHTTVPMRLNWRNGEIRVSTMAGGGLDITEGTVTLFGKTLPEAVILALPGRPVHQVFDEPFQCRSRIGHIENSHGNVVITPEADLWLVDCAKGRMWAAPGSK